MLYLCGDCKKLMKIYTCHKERVIYEDKGNNMLYNSMDDIDQYPPSYYDDD